MAQGMGKKRNRRSSDNDHFAEGHRGPDGGERDRPGSSAVSRLVRHPFRADYNDHFETQIEALRDVFLFLKELRGLLYPGGGSRQFTLYDPYYCNGAIARLWASTEFGDGEEGKGVGRILHYNRDFYKDADDGTAPPLFAPPEPDPLDASAAAAIGRADYDVLVTNPPYSADHIERFLSQFACRRDGGGQKPWAILVPDYVATKPWYQALITRSYQPTTLARGFSVSAAMQLYSQSSPSSRDIKATTEKKRDTAAPPRYSFLMSGAPMFDLGDEFNEKYNKSQGDAAGSAVGSSDDESKLGPEPFYIIPQNYYYQFDHPVVAGRPGSHFRAMWIISCPVHTSQIIRALRAQPRFQKAPHGSGTYPLTLVAGLGELLTSGIITGSSATRNIHRQKRKK